MPRISVSSEPRHRQGYHAGSEKKIYPHGYNPAIIAAAHVSSVGKNLHILEPGKPVQVRCCPATVNGDETCEKPLVIGLGRRRE
jgi:hypothetical protein